MKKKNLMNDDNALDKVIDKTKEMIGKEKLWILKYYLTQMINF